MPIDVRALRLLLAGIVIAVLGGCASPSGDGAYYGDDGPGKRAAAEFVNAPDAVPIDEPIYAPSKRPYRVFGKRYQPMTERQPFFESGVASWYGQHFQDKPTAIGEPYDMYAMTAAHPTLPLPSYVRVTNRANGRSVVVRVNDRGPFLNNRVIDLSFAAAAKLGYADTGITAVEIEVVDPSVVAGNARPARRRALELAAQLRALETASRPGDAAAAGTASQPGPTAAAKLASSRPAPPIGPVTESRIGENQQLPNVRLGNPRANDPEFSTEVPFVVRFETLPGEGVAEAKPEGTLLAKLSPAAEGSSKAPRGPPLIAEPKPSVFLQLGAYGTKQGARLARSEATEQLIWLAVDMNIVVERGLHKLQAGPFRDAADAQWASARIRRESAFSPFYVIR